MNSSEIKRWLLITEGESTGYIIGYFDDLEEAEKVMTELSAAHSDFWRIPQLFEKAMDYKSYEIHPLINQAHFQFFEKRIIDGHNFISIYDTGEFDYFTLERFLFERANTIHLYDYDIISKQKTRFGIHPDFIAN